MKKNKNVVSENRPWWMDWPMEKHSYREAPKGVRKWEKIWNVMRKINAIKESMRPQRKADKGIAIVRGAIK